MISAFISYAAISFFASAYILVIGISPKNVVLGRWMKGIFISSLIIVVSVVALYHKDINTVYIVITSLVFVFFASICALFLWLALLILGKRQRPQEGN